MKKQLLSFLFCILIVLAACNQIHACSSFAVYADKPVYGMNFDYQRFPMKFLIIESEAKGIGDGRYIAGYDYLKNNSTDFDIDKGMILLGLMKNKNPNYPTCCSMVFDPVNNHIYISLFTNYKVINRIMSAL